MNLRVLIYKSEEERGLKAKSKQIKKNKQYFCQLSIK